MNSFNIFDVESGVLDVGLVAVMLAYKLNLKRKFNVLERLFILFTLFL